MQSGFSFLHWFYQNAWKEKDEEVKFVRISQMESLKSYIADDAGHTLLFVSNENDGLNFIDAGLELSAAIEPNLSSLHLPLIADDKLETIMFTVQILTYQQ